MKKRTNILGTDFFLRGKKPRSLTENLFAREKDDGNKTTEIITSPS